MNRATIMEQHHPLVSKRLSRACLTASSVCICLPPAGAGGCVCGVPVLRAWARLVFLQPSEDCPPLRPAVPPAQRRGCLPGSHTCISSPGSTASHTGAKNLTREVRRGRVWVPKSTTSTIWPEHTASHKARGASTGAEEGHRGGPQEALLSPWAERSRN